MYRVPRLLSRAALLAIVAAMLLLSACSSGVKGQAATGQMNRHFDLTLEAYKNGQFMLDGAVLSPMDLGGHFAYLRDRHQLPKSVLLERSDGTKIHKMHLLVMARLELDYGFAVYYRKKGELRRVEVTDKNDVPQLQEGARHVPLPDEDTGKSARGVNHLPTGG